MTQGTQAERAEFEEEWILARGCWGATRKDVAWWAWQAARKSVADRPEPVWIQPDHLAKARKAPFLCRVEPARRDDFVPLYAAPVYRPEPVALTFFGWAVGAKKLHGGREWRLTLSEPGVSPENHALGVEIVPLFQRTEASPVDRPEPAQPTNAEIDWAQQYHGANMIPAPQEPAQPVTHDEFVHEKSGKRYDKVGEGTAQCAGEIRDMDPVVIYRAASGALWVRPYREFYERFVLEANRG